MGGMGKVRCSGGRRRRWWREGEEEEEEERRREQNVTIVQCFWPWWCTLSLRIRTDFWFVLDGLNSLFENVE
jgi:hypothetical protein